MNHTMLYASPLGKIIVASDGCALTGLWFEGQKYFPENMAYHPEKLAVFDETKLWLDLYFSAQVPGFTPECRLSGSEFSMAVWKILAEIPYGAVMTYGGIAREVARRLGREKMSAQAVGNAVARNPVSLVVPCHRVLGADGGLVGYAGGVDKKRWLLAMERRVRPQKGQGELF